MSTKIQAMTNAKILVVDDNEDVLIAANLLLKLNFSYIKTLSNTDKLLNILTRETFDLVLLDMNFSKDTESGSEGFYLLRTIKASFPDQKIVMMTAYGDVEKAVKCMKMGALDFFLKPWENEKLIKLIHQILQNTPSIIPPKNQLLPPADLPLVPFISLSESMRNIDKIIQKVAPTDANILITGENGTGKELIAKSLHDFSNRKSQKFVSVDMGALSETIFESELFGHIKGAFTDAKDDRIGRFEEAHKGTVFLDEIGNISLHQQSKLLTAIQSKKIVKLGSNKEFLIDCRIIAATNANLPILVSDKLFRQDLFFRLNTIEIKVPSLRERKEDIITLSIFYKNYFENMYKKYYDKFSNLDLKNLQKHPWPGNIRELKNTIERAVLLSESTNLNIVYSSENEQELSINDLQLTDLEKSAVKQALRKANGNITKAALELGITRASLYRRIEKHQL